MIEDFCKWFRDIANDPEAIISGLTVRDYLHARMHLLSCNKCRELTEKVVAERPNDDPPIMSTQN